MRAIMAMTLIGMLAAAVPVAANVGYSDGASGSLAILEQIRVERIAKLGKIRQIALRQRAADGGTLSPDSSVRLQREIDLVEMRYIRQIKKYDPFGLNADGSPARR